MRCVWPAGGSPAGHRELALREDHKCKGRPPGNAQSAELGPASGEGGR